MFVKSLRYVIFFLSRFVYAKAAAIQDTDNIQQYFSLKKVPTLWRVIPAIEDLLSEWEDKVTDPHLELYWPAIQDGIDKFTKYYRAFDKNPAIVLAICESPTTCPALNQLF